MMEERNGFLNDLSRFANEAGSTIRRAGGAALDKFDTWRLEQGLQNLYSEMGKLTYDSLKRDDESAPFDSAHLQTASDFYKNPRIVELIDKIGKLIEEIAIRKDTVKVTE